MQAYTLFADETGNTGLSHLDPDQPVYVAAGVCIPNNAQTECRDFVTALLKEKNQGSELKGGSLVKSGRGRQIAHELLVGLGQRGNVPLFVLVEKRYSLAGRFVDEYLDPLVNAHVGVEFCTDQSRMRAAANVIHGLPDEVLASVETSLRRPELETRRQAVTDVVEALRALGETELAHASAGALADPTLLEPHSVSPDIERLMRLGNTPNVAAFTGLIGNYEQVAAAVGFEQAGIVHDETSSMHDVFLGFQSRMSDPRFVATVMQEIPVVFPILRNVDTTRFAQSHEEPLVQAADVLGAVVAHLTKAAMASRQLDPSESQLAAPTLYGIFERFPVGYTVVSRRLMQQILALVKTTLP